MGAKGSTARDKGGTGEFSPVFDQPVFASVPQQSVRFLCFAFFFFDDAFWRKFCHVKRNQERKIEICQN